MPSFVFIMAVILFAGVLPLTTSLQAADPTGDTPHLPITTVQQLGSQMESTLTPIPPTPVHDLIEGPLAVYGADDRYKITAVKNQPYRMIVHLETIFPSTPAGFANFCTGWFAGPNIIVTAGHCVYDVDAHEWPEETTIYVSHNGTFTYEYDVTLTNPANPVPCNATECGYFRKAPEYAGGVDPDNDYGAIVLPTLVTRV